MYYRLLVQRKGEEKMKRRVTRKLKKICRYLDYNLYNIIGHAIIFALMFMFVPLGISNARQAEASEKEISTDEQMENCILESKIETISMVSFEEIEKKEETIVIEEEENTCEENICEKSACEEYADNLLQEGVINEQEAQMLKERGNGPDNPWMNFNEQDVILLGDAMDAEACILRAKTNKGKRAHLLTGSVALHRLNYKALGNSQTLMEVFTCVAPGGHKQYATRTIRLLGKREALNHGHSDVYDWARNLLTYGPIGPDNLIWQGAKQGVVYDNIGTEYYGLAKN